MKNEILDEIDNVIVPPKFALKSYDQFWYSIICYAIHPIVYRLVENFYSVSLSVNSFDLVYFAFLFLGTIGVVFNYFGLLNVVKSRREEEVFTWKIVVAGIGNFALFLSWSLYLLIALIF